MNIALSARSASAGLVIAIASVLALPTRLAHADEGSPDTAPCDEADGVCDADAGALQLDDGVIHLDGATGDASAAKEAQSGCSVSPAGETSVWWIPLPLALGLTLVAGRRRRRRG